MAYESNDLKGLLILVLLGIPLASSTNIDCNGKAFHCVNSTHFMICVDLGGRVTSTIDDLVIKCPPATMCHENNQFECEFPKVETFNPDISASPKDINMLIDRLTTTSQISTKMEPRENNTDTDLPALEKSAPTNKIKLEKINKEFSKDKKIEFETPIITVNNITELASARNLSMNETMTVIDEKYDKIYNVTSTLPFEVRKIPLAENNTLTAIPVLNKNAPLIKSEILETIQKQYTDAKELIFEKTSTVPTDTVSYKVEQMGPINLNTKKTISVMYKKYDTIHNITTKSLAEVTTKLPIIEDDAMTAFSVIKKDTFPIKTEILKNTKKENTEGKEIIFETTSSTTITTVRYTTEPVSARKFNINKTIAVIDEKHNESFNISTNSPIEVISNVLLTENNIQIAVPVLNKHTSPDKIEILEEINKEYTDSEELIMETSRTAPITTVSFSVEQVSVRNLNVNETTPMKIDNVTTVPSVVTIINNSPFSENNSVKAFAVLKKNISSNKTEILEKIKKGFTDGKEIMSQMTSFAPANTFNNSKEQIGAININETIPVSIENYNKIDSVTTTSPVEVVTKMTLTGNNIETALPVLNKNTPPNKTEIVHTIKKEYNDGKQMLFEMTSIAPITTVQNKYNTEPVSARALKINKTIPVIDEKYNNNVNFRVTSPTVVITKMPLTETNMEIANPALSKGTPQKKKQILEEMKEEYTGGKEMVFEMTPSTVSFSAEQVRAGNLNANETISIIDKAYKKIENVATVSSVVTLITKSPVTENNTVTAFAMLKKDTSPKTTENTSKIINKEFTDGAEMLFETTNTAPITTVSYSTEQMSARNLTANKTIPVIDQKYNKIDNVISTVPVEVTIKGSEISVTKNNNMTAFTMQKKDTSLNKTDRLENIKKEFNEGKEIVFEITNIIPKNRISNSIELMGAINLSAIETIPVTNKNYNKDGSVITISPVEVSTKMPLTDNYIETALPVLNKDTPSNKTGILEKINTKFTDRKEMIFEKTDTAPTTTVSFNDEQTNAKKLDANETIPVVNETYKKIDDIITVSSVITSTTKALLTENNIMTALKVIKNYTYPNKKDILEESKKDFTAGKEIVFQTTNTAPLTTVNYSTEQMSPRILNSIKSSRVIDEKYKENNQDSTITTSNTKLTLKENMTKISVPMLEENKYPNNTKDSLLGNIKKEYTSGKEMVLEITTPMNRVSYNIEEMSAINLNANEIYTTGIEVQPLNISTNLKQEKLNKAIELETKVPYFEKLSTTKKTHVTEATLLSNTFRDEETVTRTIKLAPNMTSLGELSIVSVAQIPEVNLSLTIFSSRETLTNPIKLLSNVNTIDRLYTTNVKQVTEVPTTTLLSDAIEHKEVITKTRKPATQMPSSTEFSTIYNPSSTPYDESITKPVKRIAKVPCLEESTNMLTATEATQLKTISDEPMHSKYIKPVTHTLPFRELSFITPKTTPYLTKSIEPVIDVPSSKLSKINTKPVTYTTKTSKNMMEAEELKKILNSTINDQSSAVNITGLIDSSQVSKTATEEVVLRNTIKQAVNMSALEVLSSATVTQALMLSKLATDKGTVTQAIGQARKIPYSKELSSVNEAGITESFKNSMNTSTPLPTTSSRINIINITGATNLPKPVLNEKIITNSLTTERNMPHLELITANITQLTDTELSGTTTEETNALPIKPRTKEGQRAIFSPVVITASMENKTQQIPLNKNSSSVLINSASYANAKKFITTETPQFKNLIATTNMEDIMSSDITTETDPVVQPTSIVEMINTTVLRSIKQPIDINTVSNEHDSIQISSQSSDQYKKLALLNKKYQNVTSNFNSTVDLSYKNNVNIGRNESLINTETSDGIVGEKINHEIEKSANENYTAATNYSRNSSQIELTPSNPTSINKNRHINYTGYDSTVFTRTNGDIAQKQILELVKSDNEEGKENKHIFELVNSTSSSSELSIDKKTVWNDDRPAGSTQVEISKSRNNLVEERDIFNNINQQQNTTWESAHSNIRYKQANQTSDKSNSSIRNVKDLAHMNETSNKPLFCQNNLRGKYADNKDCRKFYICVGNLQPIIGTCPNNTVFSEINKQCTRNLSHCIRNNQFQCLYEGRYVDFTKENIYFICLKDNLHRFLRYKLQCQNGYHLNKCSVKCEKNVDISQSESIMSSNPTSNNNKNRLINYMGYDSAVVTRINGDIAQKQILELVKSDNEEENENTHTFEPVSSTSPELSTDKKTVWNDDRPAVSTQEEVNKSRNKLVEQRNSFNNNLNQQQNTIWESVSSNISYKQANQTSDISNCSIRDVKDLAHMNETLNKPPLFSQNNLRGKYADNKDCRKFYICVGNLQPIIGTCPNNTVFSEINKQCTRNLSHCIRNNQFQCLYEGRFVDFTKDNTYFICVKDNLQRFLRYKLQCQNGYHLNKCSVKCEKNVDTSQTE